MSKPLTPKPAFDYTVEQVEELCKDLDNRIWRLGHTVRERDATIDQLRRELAETRATVERLARTIHEGHLIPVGDDSEDAKRP